MKKNLLKTSLARLLPVCSAGALLLPTVSATAADDPARAVPPAATAFSAVAITTSMEVLNDRQRLGRGDRVSYRVVEERREPILLGVTDSGEMELPLIGRVQALGKTCRQLAYEIKPMLEREYFYHATVILGLDTVGAKSRGKVYVEGLVKSQGVIDLLPDETVTVSKAILRAGGLADFANKRKVKLLRPQPNGRASTIIVDLVEILEKGRLDKDPVLEPEDRVVVVEKPINF